MARPPSHRFAGAASRRASEEAEDDVGEALRELDAARIGILLASGSEVVGGSTCMAAGTTQKVVLNTISTALMPEVGGIYRNLMVGMMPVNRKLHRRAVGIVVAACDCGEAAAEAALEAAGGDIRGAIVQLEAGCAPEACRAALPACGGRVREAVGA